MPQKQNNWTRQKFIRRWHRSAGYLSFLFVLVLSVTGLILNRTEKLNLHQIKIENNLISALYGLSPDMPPRHFKARDHWVSWLEGRLYLNGHLMARNTARLKGVVQWENIIIIGTKNSLSLYLTDGRLVEKLDSTALPGEISRLGLTRDDSVFLETPQGIFLAHNDFLSWTGPVENTPPPPAHPQNAPPHITKAIMQNFQGDGIPLSRLMLDLHSGRILGSFGPYLIDLAAISLIFLGVTGLMKRKR